MAVDAKARATAHIVQARAELDRALAEMEGIRTTDPAAVSVVAHAMHNYATITMATVEMLQLALRDHRDPDVPIWLDGIRHAADLMQHGIGRLVSVAPADAFPLKLDSLNLPLLMERACQYYRGRPEAEHMQITCRAVGEVPLVRADRVATAVVADNLLGNAIAVSPRHGTVQVQVLADGGHAVCSVRDSGPGLTADHRTASFRGLPATPPDSRIETGIAVAYEFVRRMGGQLWCESEPGRGTCFSFRLPRAS